MGAFLIMSNIRTMTETKKFEHVLVREPEYLTRTELMSTHGFIVLMLLLWVPVVIALIIAIILKLRRNKRR